MGQERDSPALSVVVVSFNAPARLERCLAALVPQAARTGAEVLVVQDPTGSAAAGEALHRRFAPARWLDAPAGTTVPRMRSLGFARSRGAIVALIEDDCVVNEGWCAAVTQAHRTPHAAIGGPVEPGDYKTGLDWAAYFCDYARFMPPFVGAVPALPGNNVSYKRASLVGALGPGGLDGGLYEVFVHATLRRAGETLWADPRLAVRNVNAWTFRQVSRVPYHHGRGFAAMRLAGRPLWRRLPYLALALALPAVQVGRLAHLVAARGRYRAQLARALPWATLFAICWSAGEFTGYLRGAGASLQHWR